MTSNYFLGLGIYVVRGVQVMLDFELAEIYGYTTSAFNQQVKNNIAKFDDDFRFQLTRDEVDELSRSKKLILNKGNGLFDQLLKNPALVLK